MDDALAALERGWVVAAATETLFGLLADATRGDALDRLRALKPRSADKGWPVLLPTRSTWRSLVDGLPPLAERLADAFWPGPLTIALPAAPRVDARLTLDGRIAVRLPGPSPAADLARAFGRPLTATSANLPGLPSAVTSSDVRRVFGRIPAQELSILDGRAPGGAPSTVVVVERASFLVVRSGRIGPAELAAATGLDPEQR